jgi:SAM-dependent methyltransferase/uncharacterized protein YbaR (Trm112 family)
MIDHKQLESRESLAGSRGIPLAFLDTLHCPYCGGELELGSAPDKADSVEQGILSCACHEYPILEGIPILQQIDGLERVTEFIRGGEPTRALLQALNLFRVRWAHRSRWHQLRYHLNCRRVVSDPSLTFAQAAQLIRRPKVFADYLVHRFANPNFLAAIGPMLLLAEPGRTASARPSATQVDSGRAADHTPRVLDLGCGAGHASFLMRRLHPGLAVVSGDQDFVSLYLGRRFLAPDATQVCWSAEVPSPFPDHCFDAVFCLDAFHYLSSKKAVVTELRRISTDDSLWLFPHLHNRAQQNLVAGIPLAPGDYLDCFGFPEARLFDETDLLLGMARRHVLDLSQAAPASQLHAAQTLTFIRGRPDIWRAHNGFPSALWRHESGLTVNPIYRGQWRADGLELELAWPNDTMKQECRGAEAILPSRCQLNRADLQLTNGGHAPADVNRLNELVASFVLVPLPRRYTQELGTAPGESK